MFYSDAETENGHVLSLLSLWQFLSSLCLSPMVSCPLFSTLPIINVLSLLPQLSLRLCESDQWREVGGVRLGAAL